MIAMRISEDAFGREIDDRLIRENHGEYHVLCHFTQIFMLFAVGSIL